MSADDGEQRVKVWRPGLEVAVACGISTGDKRQFVGSHRWVTVEFRSVECQLVLGSSDVNVQTVKIVRGGNFNKFR